MTINYSLSQDDFLEYHLYTSSQSELAKKKRQRSRLLLSVGYTAVGTFFLFQEDKNMGLTFILMGFLWFAIQPYYVRYRYKKHVTAHLKESLKGAIDRLISLTIEEDQITTKDGENEAKFAISELSRFVELPRHYFIEVVNSGSVIIPKSSLTNQNKFTDSLKKVGLDFADHSGWKWGK